MYDPILINCQSLLALNLQIFVESLLCSGRKENIKLAGDMIEKTAMESAEPQYPVNDNESTPLLHKVRTISINSIITFLEHFML